MSDVCSFCGRPLWEPDCEEARAEYDAEVFPTAEQLEREAWAEAKAEQARFKARMRRLDR